MTTPDVSGHPIPLCRGCGHRHADPYCSQCGTRSGRQGADQIARSLLGPLYAYPAVAWCVGGPKRLVAAVEEKRFDWADTLSLLVSSAALSGLALHFGGVPVSPLASLPVVGEIAMALLTLVSTGVGAALTHFVIKKRRRGAGEMAILSLTVGALFTPPIAALAVVAETREGAPLNLANHAFVLVLLAFLVYLVSAYRALYQSSWSRGAAMLLAWVVISGAVWSPLLALLPLEDWSG